MVRWYTKKKTANVCLARPDQSVKLNRKLSYSRTITGQTRKFEDVTIKSCMAYQIVRT